MRNILLAALPALVVACGGYQPLSGRGYDYDRGQAIARSDIRADRLIYYLGSDAVDRLAAQSKRVAANCGFELRPVCWSTESLWLSIG